MHEGAAGALGEGDKQGVPGVAITPRAFHLDELVIEEGPGGLLGDRLGETLLTKAYHGGQGMGESAQVSTLLLGKIGGLRHRVGFFVHGRDCIGREQGWLALDIAGWVLKPHGHALIKVPGGAGFQERVQAAEATLPG
jgi:hypothetical protein